MPPLFRAVRAALAAGLLTLLTPQPALAADDRWRSPLDGPPRVARGFAPPAVPYGPGHRGVDLLASPGAAVRAAGDGVVGHAGWLAGRPVVTVVHGDLRTTYEPVSPTVRMGARVTIGDVVGHLVEVADHCPTAGVTCLHWGLRRGSAYLDPLALLRRAPLRLLPLTPPARVSPPMPGPAGPRERATLPGPSPAAVAGTAAAASALPLASAHPRPGPPPGSRPGPTSPRAPSSLLLAPLAGAGAAAVILALPRRRAHPAPGAGDG